MRDDITNIAIEDYLHGLIPPRSEVLASIEHDARKRGRPIVGPVEGQFLYLLAKSIGARKALEIGTATGYAALWLLQAVASNGGTMEAIERKPGLGQPAREAAERAGYANSFVMHEGPWMDALARLNGPYDFVFLDILRSLDDEADIHNVIEMCTPLIRPGGVLVIDNVLCNALVLEEEPAPTVLAIQQLNRALMSHPYFETVILPIRDGVALCRKRDS